MPELWLPYGEVEIALDIRAENLAEVVTPQTQPLEDTILKERTKQLSLKDGSTIILVDAQQPSLKFLEVATALIPELGINPQSVTIRCQKHQLHAVKKVCENSGVRVAQIGEADKRIGESHGVKVMAPKELIDSECIVVTETRLDPLFGFAGGPSSLMRLMNEEALVEAFKRRSDDTPHPGQNTPSYEFCEASTDSLRKLAAAEIIPINGQVADILTGGLLDTHRQAMKQASGFITHKVEDLAKVVVLSPGRGMDLTLSSSLTAAWNVLGALREKGWLIIAAQCSRGLGSEALELYVTGRIRAETTTYVWGLEDIIFLQNVLRSNPILIVSTLPQYYLATKLGMQTARRLGEAFHMALESLGSRTKVRVVTSSSDTLLSSKQS